MSFTIDTKEGPVEIPEMSEEKLRPLVFCVALFAEKNLAEEVDHPREDYAFYIEYHSAVDPEKEIVTLIRNLAYNTEKGRASFVDLTNGERVSIDPIQILSLQGPKLLSEWREAVLRMLDKDSIFYRMLFEMG